MCERLTNLTDMLFVFCLLQIHSFRLHFQHLAKMISSTEVAESSSLHRGGAQIVVSFVFGRWPSYLQTIHSLMLRSLY